MKNKLIFAFLFFLLLVCCGALIALYEFNQELEKQIVYKEKLIENSHYRDSIFTEQTKIYAEEINKYVSGCKFIMNGKEVTMNELVKITNRSFKENAVLKDSIFHLNLIVKGQSSFLDKNINSYNNLVDSAIIYKNLALLAKKYYGVNFKVVRSKKGELMFVREITKADSALALFPFYRNKIKRDTINSNWIITTQTDKVFEKPNKTEKKLKRKK